MLEGIHLNHASLLPPVDCPLLVNIDGELRKARRTSFIERKNLNMEYMLSDGSTILGRFDWTYP